MKFVSHFLTKPYRSCHYHHRDVRSFADATAAGIKCVRDRGLDHAVARERNLRPLLNVKNLIKSEPSKSIPISIIMQQKESLRIPSRPIEFIRSYPSVFQEFLPGGIGFHPHIKLTPEVLSLDAEEQLVYQSESYKQDLANRLLKLLMISRINNIPLEILDLLKWDLGLPQDYAESIVPEFPDCFRVLNGKTPAKKDELELVCWIDELAASVLEKQAKIKNKVSEYSKGMPIAFPMKFSQGFEMDKKVKKWVDEWQKLPYISPYENATHLQPSSDESDKWAAGVLHEILNLFVSKKAERDDLLWFGEFLGIRSRFKRVMLHHPGVFYMSTKIGTYTVVLRDGYKRGMLIESSPLVKIRSLYVKLMNTIKEEEKAVSVPAGSKNEDKGRATGRNDENNGNREGQNQNKKAFNEEVATDRRRGSRRRDSDNKVNDGDGEAQNPNGRGSIRRSMGSGRGRDSRRTNSDFNVNDGDGEAQNPNGRGFIRRSMGSGRGRDSRRTNSDSRGRRDIPEGKRGSRNRHDKNAREESGSGRSRSRLMTEKI